MIDLLNPQVYTTDEQWQWWQDIKKWRILLLDRSFGLGFYDSTITTTPKLAWLEYLHLADSAITDGTITDIVPLTKLYQLQHLSPNSNQIKNTAPLKYLKPRPKQPHLDDIGRFGSPTDTPNQYCLH